MGSLMSGGRPRPAAGRTGASSGAGGVSAARVMSALDAGPTAVLAWAPEGFSSVRMRLGGHASEPDGLEAALAASHRARLLSDPGEYNELNLAPRTLRVVRQGSSRACVLEGALSDYAAYRASMQLWGRLSERRRFKRCLEGLEGVRPHRVGVSVVLLCRDSQVLLVRRTEATSWYPGCWSVPAEGASASDLEVGEDGVPFWDPSRTARRGLLEEVGVASAETMLTFFAVLADVATGALSVVGRAEVPLSGAELLEAMSGAHDAAEASQVRLLPWSRSALAQELPELSPTVPNHAFALVGAAALDVGEESCSRAGWLRLLPIPD